jgi:hypothetical protein
MTTQAANVVVASHSWSGAAATAIARRPAMKPRERENPMKKRISPVVPASCDFFTYARRVASS